MIETILLLSALAAAADIAWTIRFRLRNGRWPPRWPASRGLRLLIGLVGLGLFVTALWLGIGTQAGLRFLVASLVWIVLSTICGHQWGRIAGR